MNRQQLADAMLKGLKIPNVKESRGDYIGVSDRLFDKTCFACALGCALIGRFNGDYEKAETEFQARYDIVNLVEKVDFSVPGQLRAELDRVLAGMLGISYELAADISKRHFFGQSIKQIAQWLESDPDWAEEWEDNTNV